MLFRSGVAFALLAFSAAVAAAGEPRAPTGKWNVDFADAQCIAQRDYGTPASRLRLVLKAPALGDVMQLAVFRPAERSQPRQMSSTVSIDGRRPLDIDLLTYSPKDSAERVYLLNVPSREFALVRQAKTLEVRSKELNEAFALSQMEPLLKVLDDCVADLRRVFNVASGAKAPVGLTSRARADLVKLFSDSDYPTVAMRNGQGGRVGYALLIGEDGRVADCTIVSTSNVPSLDAQACALLKIRARFEPALGTDGKPAKDSVVGGIDWRMPAD
ncbi:MAG TPA: energy transducer TonB [Allosphingosinicella sp.]|nr:energy transducer TonB [Allosphingosinicella sp.]